MDIGFLGTDYSQSSLKEIESVYVYGDKVSDFIAQVLLGTSITQLVILNTCNRIEFYFVSPDISLACHELCLQLADFNELTIEKVNACLTKRQHGDVLRHLFRVICGVESMVFGENEILGQVKLSYEKCKASGGTQAILNKVFQSAITAGKRVRAETELSHGAYSVSTIAIEAVRDYVLDYFGKNILIIGAGEMGGRLIKKINLLGHPNIVVTSRNEQKTKTICDEYSVDYLPYSELDQFIQKFDIILTAVSVEKTLIQESHLIIKKRKTFIIDLGLPRNVDEAVYELPNVQVLTVPDLKTIADRNVVKKQRALTSVERIIDEELEKVKSWQTYKAQQCLD